MVRAGPEQGGGAGLRAELDGLANPWDGAAGLPVPGGAVGCGCGITQPGSRELSMLPALGTSGDICTWHQILSPSESFPAGPCMDVLLSWVP